jgi:hypothetical protein
MPDDRLPTREQILNLRQPIPPGTCVLCWLEREHIDNGVCRDCRWNLARRITALVVENAQLREALEDMTEYVRLGMTWIEDTDRHAKMKRAWERGREALDG